jgi:hypothetical protein
MRTIVPITPPAVTSGAIDCVVAAAALAVDEHCPGASELLLRIDAVIADHAGQAARLRVIPPLAMWCSGFWDRLCDEDCAWVAFMRLCVDAEQAGDTAAAEHWSELEERAVQTARELCGDLR